MRYSLNSCGLMMMSGRGGVVTRSRSRLPTNVRCGGKRIRPSPLLAADGPMPKKQHSFSQGSLTELCAAKQHPPPKMMEDLSCWRPVSALIDADSEVETCIATCSRQRLVQQPAPDRPISALTCHETLSPVHETFSPVFERDPSRSPQPSESSYGDEVHVIHLESLRGVPPHVAQRCFFRPHGGGPVCSAGGGTLLRPTPLVAQAGDILPALSFPPSPP